VERIYRYDDLSPVSTPLDPFTDLSTWIHGLRSKSYTEDFLRDVHKIRNKKYLDSAVLSTSAHAEIAMRFLEDALSSSPSLSYLPLYYSLLNLAKIVIIINGGLQELQNNRTHGARWSGITDSGRNLLNDHITLMSEGTIPLFYKALTGSMWPVVPHKDKNSNTYLSVIRRVYIRNIYPYIKDISHEYISLGRESQLSEIEVMLDISGGKGNVIINFPDGNSPGLQTKHRYKILSKLKLDLNKYSTKKINANSQATYWHNPNNYFRRFLMYDRVESVKDASNKIHQKIYTFTPISGSNLLLPEEFPILLAFFY